MAAVAQPSARKALVKGVENGADKLAASAADALLRHHSGAITPALYAKCACLAVEERGAWGLILLSEQMERIKQEPDEQDRSTQSMLCSTERMERFTKQVRDLTIVVVVATVLSLIASGVTLWISFRSRTPNQTQPPAQSR